RRDARHADRLRAVRVQRTAGRLSHAPERHRTRERDVGRRASAGIRHTMKRMSPSMFGSTSAELEAGARNAVEVCLAIQPDERVALIADEASGDVAASIAAALDDVGAPWE